MCKSINSEFIPSTASFNKQLSVLSALSSRRARRKKLETCKCPTSSERLRVHCVRGDGYVVRTRSQGAPDYNNVFWNDRNLPYINLPASLVACKRSNQVKFCHEVGERLMSPILAEELLTIYDFQKWKSQFSLCVWPLNRSTTL